MAIGRFEQATAVFAGQGDLIMFDPITNYDTATFASLTGAKSFGQIVQDSTTWEGEDPETNSILDEQGNTITSTTSAGTLGFSFDIASTSPTMIEKFLNGEKLETLTNSDFLKGPTMGVKFGVELPVQTRPLMIVNDDKTKAWLYPKSKMVCNLSLEDGLWRIHATVTCEYLNTKDLATGMYLQTTGNLNYDQED